MRHAHVSRLRGVLTVILGIGVDLCGIERLRRAIDGEVGARFCARVFTSEERAYCDGRGRGRGESYAARFAAKEAAAKALGVGIGAGISWQDVEVHRTNDGPPRLRLSAKAARIASSKGIVRWHLSLSHADGVAVAMVVAEGSVSPDSDDGATGAR